MKGDSKIRKFYLKHFLTNKDSLSYLKSLNVNQHIHSRQSPYPFTSLSRFPVFDKYVSWDNLYDSYDKILDFPQYFEITATHSRYNNLY